jgi:hypothetical protein
LVPVHAVAQLLLFLLKKVGGVHDRLD